MVGVGPASSRRDALARVSIVDAKLRTVFDEYVLPDEPVTDFRTPISGITASHLKRARPFMEVQREVAEVLKGALIIGHSLKSDFGVLLLAHPRDLCRDSAHVKKFQTAEGKPRRLRDLARQFLGLSIQVGEHSSVEDAMASMRLYLKYSKDFSKPRRPKTTATATPVPVIPASESAVVGAFAEEDPLSAPAVPATAPNGRRLPQAGVRARKAERRALKAHKETSVLTSLARRT
jgi:RNA exonuclease 4